MEWRGGEGNIEYDFTQEIERMRIYTLSEIEKILDKKVGDDSTKWVSLWTDYRIKLDTQKENHKNIYQYKVACKNIIYSLIDLLS